MITKMRYASITVSDIDQAMDFYVNKLGFRVVIQMPLPGGNQFSMLAPPDGGSNLVFSLPTSARPHPPPHPSPSNALMSLPLTPNCTPKA